MSEAPLWTPSEARREASNLARFMREFEARTGATTADFAQFHAQTVKDPEAFWTAMWDFGGVKAQTRGERVLVDRDKIPGARFFPDARLNYARNLLVKSDDTAAIVFRGENGARREMSWRKLNETVSRFNQAFAAFGLAAGDRVCAVVPNCAETIAVFLGAVSLGGIWSSCSPDFGERGILDRFGQIGPRMLIACDGYHYNGKTFDLTEKIEAVLRQLPTVEKVIVLDFVGKAEEAAERLPNAVTYARFIEDFRPGPIAFDELPFDHPLYILYSSGTTGAPKCIVHRAGGALLKHLSELLLHCDVKPSDRLFFFTTCGWMMWNWLVSGLASGATLLLYDGSPFWPNERAVFDFADAEAMTILGTSAKYIDAVKKTGWRPRDTHSLGTVRTILSTGSPLAAESFDFVYEAIKEDVQLSSMSGGTDICGCFVGGNPMGPVWRGEIQAPSVAQAVDVFDEEGRSDPRGKGELVCTNAFPSMPLMFWNDPDGSKYHNAYFARFPNVWCHGDFAEWTEHGGMIIYGRSDATLNPGGVRIGTAEIYAQVEQIPEVIEALAIGQDWDNDVRIVLFVRLRPEAKLDEALERRIRQQIRTGASPRHVPARIVAVADIPRTKSGKITELAVRDVVHGRSVKNVEALANPEALALFKDLADLRR